MIDPIAIGETKEFICKDDKENPTTWIIGSIDSIEKAHIFNVAKDLSSIGAQDATLMLFEAVRFGLKGFKNFGKAEFKTKMVKFMDKEREVIDDDILRSIPYLVVTELANEILRENSISEVQEKN